MKIKFELNTKGEVVTSITELTDEEVKVIKIGASLFIDVLERVGGSDVRSHNTATRLTRQLK